MSGTSASRAIPVALIAALVAVSAAAQVTPAAQAAIAARQAGYKKMGAAMKALGTELKAGTPNTAAMAAAAQTIAATSREQARLFPAGSGPQPGVKTDALPGIWTDRAAFDAASNRLIAESAKLVVLAKGGDAAAIGAQMKATGATCGACHRQFRADT